MSVASSFFVFFFFFNDTATTEIYTLSLHDAPPIKPSASSCSQNAGSSSGPSPGSGDAEGWPRTGNVSTAKRSLSSSSLLFASCFESYAIQDDVPGQTLSTVGGMGGAPLAGRIASDDQSLALCSCWRR